MLGECGMMRGAILSLIIVPISACSTTQRVSPDIGAAIRTAHPGIEVQKLGSAELAERLVIRRRGRGALEGLGFGVLAGVLMGAAVNALDDGDERCEIREGGCDFLGPGLEAGIVGVAAGALFGAMIGAAIGHRDIYEVHGDAPAMSVVLTPSGDGTLAGFRITY